MSRAEYLVRTEDMPQPRETVGQTLSTKGLPPSTSTCTLPPSLLFKIVVRLRNALTWLIEKVTPTEMRIMDTALSYWRTQCLYVTAKLAVADKLADSPKNAKTLAEELTVNADLLERLLRFMSEMGYFKREADGTYALNRLSERLRTNHPLSQRYIAILAGEEPYRAWGHLLTQLKTDETGFERAFGLPFFDYYTKNPQAGRMFDNAMVAFSIAENEAIAQDYDFSGFESVVDVGGGKGALLNRILESHPTVKGVLFDLPNSNSDQNPYGQKSPSKSSRMEVRSGNFFERVPGGHDAYLLKNIVHDWPNDQVVKIYETIRRGCRSSSKILLAEHLIDFSNPLRRVTFALDLNMAIMFNGRERSLEEHQALLAAAGFEIERVIATRSVMSVIEAGVTR